MKTALRVAVPELEVVPAPSPSGMANSRPLAPFQPETPPPASSKGNVSVIASLALMGVGLAATGVGSYFGLHAKSLNDDAENHHCTAANCDPTGVNLVSDARQTATASTVAFAVGAAAVVAGVIIYLVRPKSASLPKAHLNGAFATWHLL
jgi:hypothetical protein